ncbi:MAG: DnaJ domain-containing protein [Parcubacteria group bacterium]|nr:DnaJ domain-containing protein [Parcubacteria group bacterium]
MSKDFYTILGIARGAQRDDIKKAFHSLARKYHPDNKDTGDEARFKEINEAYQTLSDDKRRAEYDAYGHVFNHERAGGQAEGFSGWGGFGGDASGWQNVDLGDIFGEFFGGGYGRGRQERGRDISIDLNISFEESIFGVPRAVLLAKTAVCDSCGGSGAEKQRGFATCTACNGQGRTHETHTSIFGTLSSVRECGECRGEGKVPKSKCAECFGLGVLKKQEEITIKIPPGINDGEVVRLSGFGEAVPQGGVSGDLYARVHVAPHETWKREGRNLIADLHIKLSDALLGAEYTVKTLDGTNLKLKIPAGISFGEKLRVRGKGVPIEGGRGRRGDLLVKLLINLPKHLSRKAEKLVEDMKKEGI